MFHLVVPPHKVLKLIMRKRINNRRFESFDHQIARGLSEIAFQRNENPFFIREVFREIPSVFIVKQTNHPLGDHAVILAYFAFPEKKISFSQSETYENIS